MKEKYQLLLQDDFDAGQLNTDYWFPFYLPQWSSRKKSMPSYKIKDSILTLYISNHQQPWCQEWNGDVRVSNLQTGVFSGPLGSKLGQHRFTDSLLVREQQETEIKVALHYGWVEFKARCRIAKENVAALWLIGTEKEPQESAEICLFELKGWNVAKGKSIIGYGVHPFGDAQIQDSFYEEEQSIEVEAWNTYAFDWDEAGIDFYINGICIKHVNESPDYPMQLMLNLYNIGQENDEQSVFEIDYVKVYQLNNRNKHF